MEPAIVPNEDGGGSAVTQLLLPLGVKRPLDGSEAGFELRQSQALGGVAILGLQPQKRRGRGKPPIRLDPTVKERIFTGIQTKDIITPLGVSNTTRGFFRYLGCHHLMFSSPKGVLQQNQRMERDGRWENDHHTRKCTVCLQCTTSRGEVFASLLIDQAAEEAKEDFQDKIHVVVQPKWPDTDKAVDFMLVIGDVHSKEMCLLIEVDGEQHTTKSIHDNSPAEQKERDREFDKLVVEKGHRLLRLHHRNNNTWRWSIKNAITMVRQNKQWVGKGNGVVWYSDAYQLEDVVPWPKKTEAAARTL
jgi:hypothetical protein